MFSTSPIAGTYASEYFKTVLGADDFLLSVITFSGLIAIALVQFPGGYLADKHGRRWLVYTMTFGVAFAYLFFIFAPSWPLIVLGTMIQNLCLLYQPALFAIMIDSVSPENRGAGFSMQAVITNLVGLPASLIAGYLVLVFNLNIGMRIAYAIAMIAYFAAALLRVRLKETLPSFGGDDHPTFLAAFKEYPKAVRESLGVWSRTPRSVYYLFICNAAINSLIVGCSTYFVIYATENLKISNFQWALLMALMSFTVAVPSVIAGLRMDRVGRKNYVMASYLCYIPAMVLFVFGDFYVLMLAFFFGLGQVLQSSSYQSLLGDLTPRELRGRVVGCSQIFGYIAQAFTQILIGLLFSYVWRPLPFLMLASSVIPLALIVRYRVFEEDKKQI